jgi:hypothetical protein
MRHQNFKDISASTEQKVYNLEVANLHTYAASTSGMVVPNKAMQNGPIKPAGGKHFDPNQNALIQLAKECKRQGVTSDEVNIQKDWLNKSLAISWT